MNEIEERVTEPGLYERLRGAIECDLAGEIGAFRRACGDEDDVRQATESVVVFLDERVRVLQAANVAALDENERLVRELGRLERRLHDAEARAAVVVEGRQRERLARAPVGDRWEWVRLDGPYPETDGEREEAQRRAVPLVLVLILVSAFAGVIAYHSGALAWVRFVLGG